MATRVARLATIVLSVAVLVPAPAAGDTSTAEDPPTPATPARVTAAEADDPPTPSIQRLFGPNRYATAAAITTRRFPGTIDTVYVATGAAFPDALAAGGVAGGLGAPILLTPPDSLPDATADELERMGPDQVVVLGGTSAVDGSVEDAIRDAAGAPVRRVAGTDRFDTAARLSAESFSPGVEVVYIAVGTNFPDALAGGPRAERDDAPILLVAPDVVPEATSSELTRLSPGRIVVLGGAGAVSDAVVAELEDYTDGGVTRLEGRDRFLTAVAISEDGFDSADTVYLATGLSFPDALGGAPAAIGEDGPILLTLPDCVPDPVADEIARLRAGRVVVLGGQAAVGDRGAALVPCGTEADIPLPTFAVDESLTPTTASLPGHADGEPARPVGVIRGADGTQVDVVEDELIVVGPAERMDEVADRVGGAIADQVDGVDVSVAVIDVGPIDVDRLLLPALVRQMDPRAHGQTTVSSEGMLDLMTVAAQTQLDGILIGLNPLPYLHAGEAPIVARDVGEAPSATGIGGYTANPFDWNWLNETATPSIGVTEAWRALALAGRFPATDADRIRIGILDGGFAESDDYPPGTLGIFGEPNPADCSGGNPCPWHGTGTSLTAAGVVDNDTGTAGVAGPVATLSLGGWTGDLFTTLGSYLTTLAGSRIVNMSFSFEIPGGVGFILAPLDAMLEIGHIAGQMYTASAGNNGEIDVDAVDCILGFCWENAVIAPCELNRVICVGGLAAGSTSHDGNSSYGSSSVDIWAPFTVYAGADPANPANQARPVSGTSYSAPYVAGVLALIQAAMPTAGVDTVERFLFAAAKPGSGRATRYVDAYDSVVRALGNNLPPEFAVTSPADGATYRRGQTLGLGATLSDPDDSGATITWFVDGLEVGTGTSVDIALTKQNYAIGDHDVRARFTDGPYSFDIERTIVIESTPPTVEITNPATGYDLCQSCEVTLRAISYDPDETGDSLSGTQYVWRNGSDVLGNGAAVTISGSDLGDTNNSYTVTLTGQDSHFDQGTDSIVIDVVADPTSFPPTAMITSPPNGAYKFQEGSDPDGQFATFTFTGTGDDHEDGALPGTSLSWTAYGDLDGNGSEEREIDMGTGSSVTEQLYADCAGPWTDEWRIVLTATDSDAKTGTDEIVVTVGAFC